MGIKLDAILIHFTDGLKIHVKTTAIIRLFFSKTIYWDTFPCPRWFLRKTVPFPGYHAFGGREIRIQCLAHRVCRWADSAI